MNKLNTKATLRIKLSDLKGLSETEFCRLQEILGSRLCLDNELVINSSEERSQRINLERAYARAETLITVSARLPKKRKASRPSAAIRENRLRAKRLISERKANRRYSQGMEE